MPDLPFDDLTDPLKLADWLELYALSSPDHNSSQGDLESALHRAAIAELYDDEVIELKTMEVFDELEQRSRAAQEAYPFDLDYRGLLRLKSTSWEDYPAYVFCLCLSYFPLRETRMGTRLFEHISCLAVRSYLQGKVIGFGAPRTELPSSFADAVTEMCKRIGEGIEYRKQPSLHRQDDTLDLVAWKDFVDKRPSKILIFGQCGAGRNWAEKLGDLQPEAFWNQWMAGGPVSPFPIRSFFTPYRIAPDKWEFYARKAGVLFDRCRIAFWVHGEEADYDPIVEWARDFLAQDEL
jgi:hypothetical protein